VSGALDFSEKRTVLVVDDTPENLAVLSGVLRPHYTVKVAPSGERALQIALSDDAPDIILLDIMMPEMDGYEVLRRLQAAAVTEGIPVIFVTAKDQENDEQVGLDLGAVDYITKPISPAILLARVRTHLLLKEARDYLKEEKRYLRSQLFGTQIVAIHAFSSLAETRDDETPNHLVRMQRYVRALAEELRKEPQYAAFFTTETMDLLFECVPLHDIGKVGLPDHALLAAGADDLETAQLMRKHPAIGRDVIARVQERVGGDAAFLQLAHDIVYSHQERWDGGGYPQGLQGEAIPVAARLVALADLYDTLASQRPHSPPTPHDEVVTIIRAASGTHFDPVVVDAFMAAQDEFRRIAARYADSATEVEAHLARMKG